MEFNNLNEGTNCICTSDTSSPVEEVFAIKTSRELIRDVDFESYWEKGRRPQRDSCQETCSLKGKSMSIFNTDTRENVIKIFKELFPLAPKYKPFLCEIKLNNDTGLIKHTPSNTNPHHYDFYKCDAFNINNIEIITVNELH